MSIRDNNTHPSSEFIVAYDGECPFCKSYIHLTRLHELDIKPTIINLRDDSGMVETLKQKGYDSNQGLYVRYSEQDYHGDDAMIILSSLSSDSRIFNKIMKWAFSSKPKAKVIYPLLRAGRNVTLWLLGRKQL